MMSTIPVAACQTRRMASRIALALCGLVAVLPMAHAQTPLADVPILASQSVPGNVALPLSVEWPTTQRMAHTDAYSTAAQFLGYFDPNKCYDYKYDNSDTAARPTDVTKVSYFQPAGAATAHVCVSKWSGNFLNWAMTPTIDPFRWGLTGGFRLVDTQTLTILEKAWNSGQGGLFPDRAISGGLVSGATPFNFATLNTRVNGLGNKMRFTGTGDLNAAPTAYTGSGGTVGGTTYEVFARARVCDASSGTGGVETNCVQYGANWKPEGLMQKYAMKMRFSAFGYLNDSSPTRDGGVLRARQKFVGPTQPVPGSTAITNAGAEWDASTGVFVLNPDAADATATNAAFTPATNVTNSGVMNYLNKFGEIAPSSTYQFKSFDPVSELYYAAVRYFKNQGNVPEYTDMSAGDQATRTTWIDGFPVITNWTDPIQYSCQRNFILGIGDIYTWNDKNLPGSGTGTTSEPTKPGSVASDTSVSAVTATNKVFSLESLGAPNWDNYSGRNNSAGIVGLAYDSHTKDIRPDLADMQTIDTYWVDVLEAAFESNNQFYLAAKYGGFTVPTGFDPYGTTAVPAVTSWHTATGSPDTNYVGAQLRPDNYFTGGKPDLMVAGLTAAFDKIAASLTAVTTSFSTSLPQVAQSGNASYSSQYDGANWTGELTASTLTFAAGTDNPSLTQAWLFTARLTAQLSATGSYLTNRRIVSWSGTGGVQFCSGTAACTVPLTAAQLTALNPSYTASSDSADYLNYLRGDKTNEKGAGGTDAYRTRVKPLGDIVGSKARPVGPPAFPYSDSANPGYSAFRSTYAGRPTVVYVGSNDGMMHAIQGDLTASGGTELFAYVPSALFRTSAATSSVDGLGSLGNPSFVHHFMVNATPNVYDVDFSRTAGSTPTTTGDWRSILIGGLGKGGKSYYAIDVTDPVGMAASEASVASKVLWEFTDTDLGYTYGDSIVVKTPKWGWVVIITSGYNNADGKGYFFIINPKTGALLEKISTGVGAATAAGSAGLAFANAFVLDGTDGTIDAVYAGDLLGNLWRWDVSGTGIYPAPLRLAILTDGANPQPVTSRPLIEVHPSLKKRFVLVGTGRLLDNADINSTQGQSFYAIADGTNARFNAAADLPSPITFPITRSVLSLNSTPLDLTKTLGYDPATQMGWVEDLGAGWRVTTDPTSLLGSVAWAATLPSVADVCKPSGNSRVYARDFGTAITTLRTLTDTPLAYFGLAGNVTDLHYLSVDGKARLVAGTDLGGDPTLIPITPPTTSSLRRLNWRELQTVE
jgi:type IV pilus assembly protein PilY1